MARSAFVPLLVAILALAAGVAQAHEVEGCTFATNISSIANLTVAGQAIEALGDASPFVTHGTVFLPTDAAFTALVTALNVTPADLLGDALVNTTVAILAYHFLPDSFYPPAALVGNKTIETGLAELASEANGRNVSYPLTFQQRTLGKKEIRVRSENTTATILDKGADICNRYVYTIDTVLIPEDNLADIPQNITAVLAARAEAEEAEEEGDEAPAPAPSDDDSAAGLTAAAAAPLLAALAAGSLLLQAL